jgi:hypothetical protein
VEKKAGVGAAPIRAPSVLHNNPGFRVKALALAMDTVSDRIRERGDDD